MQSRLKRTNHPQRWQETVTVQIIIGMALLFFTATCAGDNGDKRFDDSPYAALIPECGKLWEFASEFADNGSRYFVVGPDSGSYYIEESAVEVTERRCKSSRWKNRAGFHITQFSSPLAAQKHVDRIRSSIDGIYTADGDYPSVFREPYWDTSANYAVPLFGPKQEFDPENELGLHISVQAGSFTIDYSGNALFEVGREAEVFLRLELMRDRAYSILQDLNSR